MKGTIADWEREHFSERLTAEIAALPETAEPEALETLEVAPDPCVLLERDYAGLRVEVAWHPNHGITLYVRQGEDKPWVTSVPADRAFDAFHHPFCYLPA